MSDSIVSTEDLELLKAFEKEAGAEPFANLGVGVYEFGKLDGDVTGGDDGTPPRLRLTWTVVGDGDDHGRKFSDFLGWFESAECPAGEVTKRRKSTRGIFARKVRQQIPASMGYMPDGLVAAYVGLPITEVDYSGAATQFRQILSLLKEENPVVYARISEWSNEKTGKSGTNVAYITEDQVPQEALSTAGVEL